MYIFLISSKGIRSYLLVMLLFIISHHNSVAFALTTTEIFNNCSASVVTIYTTDSGEKIHQGSGVFIEKSGLILTNYHVIHNFKKIMIQTIDGDLYNIRKVLAQDPEKDLALLISATPTNKIKPLLIAPAIPKTGSKIVTIGTPRGFSHSLSEGIISSVSRGEGDSIIQFTAPVSSGSSGSPLLEERGRVIGIVTFQHNAAQNINFAMSSVTIADFIKTRPYITQREYELAKRAQTPDKQYNFATKGSAIFKLGEYVDTFAYQLEKQFKSTMPGALGIHFWFEFIEPCLLQFTGLDKAGYEIYLPPEGIGKATYAGLSVLSRGDTVGIYRNPKNGTLGWFVDNSNYNATNTVWSRTFKQKEYLLLTELDTVSWKNNARVFIVQYMGVDFDTNEVLLRITDNRRGISPQEKITIDINELPGYFDIAGGKLDINKVDTSVNYPVLHYEWVVEPR